MSTTPSSLDDELKAVQLARERLGLQKLEVELVQLKKGKAWYDVADQTIVGLLTAMVAALGFGFGIYQYAHQQSENRATAEREFMKPWLENQREIYMRAISAAATLANADDPEKRKAATDEFWALYQGQMILVETKSVSGGMVNFGHCFDGRDSCDRAEMNSRSRALATAMAQSMAATARMTFAEFADNQFKYSAGP